MPRGPGALPDGLGAEFSVGDAARSGVGRGRLRGSDLERPFHGVRRVRLTPVPARDPFEQRRDDALRRARAYATRMRHSEFFSHETAALIWGAPLPPGPDGGIHVAVHSPHAEPRAAGVIGHRLQSRLVTVATRDGIRLASPASMWALLGDLPTFDLVAVGDYLVREWRFDGYFRVNQGMPPLTTRAQLAAALAAGRRRGGSRLRSALALIREDSWSRPESLTRCHLVTAGLPEPILNRDYFDECGEHLGCIDLSYPAFRVAIEYQGQHHGAQYAQDIERIERLRANGWIVIQVTSILLANAPAELVSRVRTALISRGWRG